jgi:hypothetical protein
MTYESTSKWKSTTYEGVTFRVLRMSFGRRLELLKRLRGFATSCEVQRSGDTTDDRVEAAISEAEMRKTYLEWGLEEVSGLTIDGEPATRVRLIEAGPEELCNEIADRIRSECFLSEEERKN